MCVSLGVTRVVIANQRRPILLLSPSHALHHNNLIPIIGGVSGREVPFMRDLPRLVAAEPHPRLAFGFSGALFHSCIPVFVYDMCGGMTMCLRLEALSSCFHTSPSSPAMWMTCVCIICMFYGVLHSDGAMCDRVLLCRRLTHRTSAWKTSPRLYGAPPPPTFCVHHM